MKNYRIITEPKLIKGIPILGWALLLAISMIIFDIAILFGGMLIAIGVEIPVALILYITLRIKSTINPDFLNIKLIKIFYIKRTINADDFKGNCYVS